MNGWMRTRPCNFGLLRKQGVPNINQSWMENNFFGDLKTFMETRTKPCGQDGGRARRGSAHESSLQRLAIEEYHKIRETTESQQKRKVKRKYLYERKNKSIFLYVYIKSSKTVFLSSWLVNV